MDTLAELAAHLAVQKCSIRYMRGLDRLDHGLQFGAFHENATVDYGFFKGSAKDFVAFSQKLLTRYAKTLHTLGQMDIELDVSTGTGVGEVYFTALHRTVKGGIEEDLMIAGRYHDRYAFRDGRWAIAERMEIVDWTRTDPARDDWLIRTPDAIVGSRLTPENNKMTESST